MFRYMKPPAFFLLSLLLLSQCRAALGLVHSHKRSHIHLKRHAHASHVSRTDNVPQSLEQPAEKRSEEGLPLVRGVFEGPPGGPSRFLDDLRQLREYVEDNFQDVKDLLNGIVQMNRALLEEIESLRESQYPPPTDSPLSTEESSASPSRSTSSESATFQVPGYAITPITITDYFRSTSTSTHHETTYTTRVSRTVILTATTTPATTSSTGNPPYSVPANSSTSLGPTGAPVSAFNPQASSNIAVYYTQASKSNLNNQTGLMSLCMNSAVDIVNLQLIATVNGPSGFPIFANTTDCMPPSPEAPSLQDCSNLAETVIHCQSLGKKIIIGLGSSHYDSSANSTVDTPSTIFTDSAEAVHAASILLSLFGPPSNSPFGELAHLRPFGPNVSVDGFDIGFYLQTPTDAVSAYYQDFISTLRYYTREANEELHLSATQPCRRPVSAQALATLMMLDSVNIKFFDDPACSIDSSGFNIWDWSQDLRAAVNSTTNSTSANSTAPTGPKLYAAALAWPSATGNSTSGEGDPRYLSQSIDQIWRSGRLPNLGGVALMEGRREVTGGSWWQVGSTNIGYVDAAISQGVRERARK